MQLLRELWQRTIWVDCRVHAWYGYFHFLELLRDDEIPVVFLVTPMISSTSILVMIW